MTLDESIAKAICEAFWETAERPMTWMGSTPLQRQVWVNCARAALAEGRRIREQRQSGGQK